MGVARRGDVVGADSGVDVAFARARALAASGTVAAAVTSPSPTSSASARAITPSAVARWVTSYASSTSTRTVRNAGSDAPCSRAPSEVSARR